LTLLAPVFKRLTGIADQASPIICAFDQWSDDSGGAHTHIVFTVQVQNRAHLSRLMRAMRALPEVSRIHRLQSEDSKSTPKEA
jgi:(p)ppGpp synthase/HD superfamily hydrolase